MSEKDSSLMVGTLMLLAGGIIGAGVALLYAPQSGEKTRKGISRCARKARRRTEQAIEDFSGNVTEMVDTLGGRASDILDKGKDMAYGAKKDLLRALEEGEARLHRERTRLAKLIG